MKKHGPYHNCTICKMAKTVGMMETPKDEQGHLCTCGSHKKYEDCHGEMKHEHEHHDHHHEHEHHKV